MMNDLPVLLQSIDTAELVAETITAGVKSWLYGTSAPDSPQSAIGW
jgi:hypothetical protein